MKKNIISKLSNNEYVYSVIAKILGVVIGIVYSIIYNRYLGSELVGTASVITNYSDLCMLFLTFGIYQAYPFFKKTNYHKGLYREYINLITGIFLLYIVLGLIMIIIFKPSTDIIMTIILIPMMFSVKELNYVVLIEDPKSRNSASIRLSIFELILIIFFALVIKVDYSAMIVYLIIYNFVVMVSAFARLRVNILSIRPTLKNAWPYIKFGFLPMLTVIMMEINYKADVLMLEQFGIAKSDIGIYQVGVGLAQKVWLIPDAIKDILLSKLAKGRPTSEVCRVTRLSLVIVIVCVIGLIVLGEPIINIMYGSEFRGAYPIIVTLIIGIIGMVFYKMIYSYNVINGHRKINLVLLCIAAFVNIIINFVLIPKQGIIGAAIASTISYVACGLGFAIMFCKMTKTSIKELLILNRNDINAIKSIVGKGGRDK